MAMPRSKDLYKFDVTVFGSVSRFAHSMNACTFVYSNNQKKQHDISSLLTPPTTTVVIDFKLYINYIASCSISSARFKANCTVCVHKKGDNKKPATLIVRLFVINSLSIFKHSTKLYLHSLICVFSPTSLLFHFFCIYNIHNWCSHQNNAWHHHHHRCLAPTISQIQRKKKLAYYWRTFKSHLNNIQVWKQTCSDIHHAERVRVRMGSINVNNI